MAEYTCDRCKLPMTAEQRPEVWRQHPADVCVALVSAQRDAALKAFDIYGCHIAGCSRLDGEREPCTCGYWDECQKLRAVIDAERQKCKPEGSGNG